MVRLYIDRNKGRIDADDRMRREKGGEGDSEGECRGRKVFRLSFLNIGFVKGSV